MKVNTSLFKTILVWLLAMLMAAAHPLESKESVKEIEDTEEVRLYFQVGKHVQQKPKTSPGLVLIPRRSLGPFSIPKEVVLERLAKYLLYCNLIYYQ